MKDPSTTTSDLTKWWFEGLDKKATHMIIITDQFDYTEYPRYAMSLEEAKKIIKAVEFKEMESIIEIYNYGLDLNMQLNEERANHLEVKRMRITKSSIDNLAEKLTTALRKLCDSKPTSIVYNIIGSMEERFWEKYLEYIIININDREFENRKGLENYMKEIHNKMVGNNIQFLRDNTIAHNLFRSFSITCSLFTDQDWKNYCGYLTLKGVK